MQFLISINMAFIVCVPYVDNASRCYFSTSCNTVHSAVESRSSAVTLWILYQLTHFNQLQLFWFTYRVIYTISFKPLGIAYACA